MRHEAHENDSRINSFRDAGLLQGPRPQEYRHGAGSLIQREDSPKPVIQVLAYGPDSFVEDRNVAPEQLPHYVQEWPVTWIQVSGLGDPAVIKSIGAQFHLHELSLEDVVEGLQRPKIDIYDDYVFLVGWHAEFNEHLEAHQFSIVLGSHVVITFQSRSAPLGGDCYDHITHVMDLIETCRELGFGLMDVYMSCVSNRTNQIMKVLTIFSTIFIPLSFVASLYGMNFNTGKSPWNMPELDWYYGYPYALLLMAAVAIGLLVFYRVKGWLGGKSSK